MPTVPGNNVVQMPQPQIEPTYLAMAAATMHEMGRLVEPEPKTKLAGDYMGNYTHMSKEDQDAWDKEWSEAVEFKGKPQDFMKTLPKDVEGSDTDSSKLMFLRKKKPPGPEDLVS
jgi:hypothetical protein